MVRFDQAIGCLRPIDQEGPSVLLFRKESMAEYLAANNLCLFWTVLAERSILGDSHENYIGHVEANGFYLMSDSEITGTFVPKFFPKGTWDKDKSPTV